MAVRNEFLGDEHVYAGSGTHLLNKRSRPDWFRRHWRRSLDACMFYRPNNHVTTNKHTHRGIHTENSNDVGGRPAAVGGGCGGAAAATGVGVGTASTVPVDSGVPAASTVISAFIAECN